MATELGSWGWHVWVGMFNLCSLVFNDWMDRLIQCSSTVSFPSQLMNSVPFLEWWAEPQVQQNSFYWLTLLTRVLALRLTPQSTFKTIGQPCINFAEPNQPSSADPSLPWLLDSNRLTHQHWVTFSHRPISRHHQPWPVCRLGVPSIVGWILLNALYYLTRNGTP